MRKETAKMGKRTINWDRLILGMKKTTKEFIENVLAVVTDISEIQSLKEELFQSEKMSLVDTLASEVAHEINNPLGGLIMKHFLRQSV